MGCSDHDQREEPVFKQINKAIICFLIFVCHTEKHVHVLRHASQRVREYVSRSLSFSVCPVIASHLSGVCVRSQVFSRLVLRLRGSEVILQEGLQVLESVPLVGLPPPALHHQFME